MSLIILEKENAEENSFIVTRAFKCYVPLSVFVHHTYFSEWVKGNGRLKIQYDI